MLTLNDGRSELWQWDTGRTLSVDADCSQVHFSNKVFGRSIDVDVIDGIAVIPDILLQTDKDLNVWAFVGTAENGYTKISKTLKVNRRNKPADYVFTPPEQTTLAELVDRLDKIEESQGPDAIKNAVEDYLEQNPVEVPVKSVNGKTGTVELNAEDVGAISQEDLQAATNEALAQAKASGEFDGADGAPGPQGDTGATGADGKSAYAYAVEGGYTGTEEEFAAKMAAPFPEVDDTLTQPGQPADAAKVGEELHSLSEEIANLNTDGISATARNLLITILRNGVYISDQNANITGLGIALGGSDAPVVKSYAITNTLTNCTTNNAETSVIDGGSYTATLTADDGYTLNSVVVTMGGTDITSTAYSDSVITIASVTGDVSIVATAVATESGGSETVVNLFDKNTMVITGYFWGTNGAPNSNAGSKYVKVPVEAGKTYAIQKSGTYDKSQWDAGGNGMVSWVSADGTALSAAINTNALNAHIDPNSKGVVTSIAPDGVVYICFSVKVFENGIDYTDTTMVEEGDTCHDYVAYA